MLFVADIGNTVIKIGVYDREVLKCTARLSSAGNRSSDEYAVTLQAILQMNGVDVQKIRGAVIASVVKPLSPVLGGAVEKLCGIKPLFMGPGVRTGLDIKIENDDCLRYCGLKFDNVSVNVSPVNMRIRLFYCGMRAINFLADMTNYLMLEMGQPMHAFDYTALQDRTVVVRTAKNGEKIKTLDGEERTLDETMLVICDSSRPNAVAGVMGGEDSGVAEKTKSLLLESALFDPASIKSTSTKLGLGSESSYRYIRGVDKDLADFASRRAAHLLQKYGQAEIARGIIDIDNRRQPLNENVSLSFDRARKLIGIDIENSKMVDILKSIGLEPVGEFSPGSTSVTFAVPSWRWDISLEADLVEEIARLYGLDNIPDTVPSAPSISTLDESKFKAKSRIRDILASLGFTEAMHYSFLNEKELDEYSTADKESRLVIPDPVSVEFGVMRSSLLPQMLQSLGRNSSHEANGAMLFEIGKVFSAAKAQDRVIPCEKEMLSLGFFGPVGREALRRRAVVSEEEAVLWMKGAVENFLSALHLGKVEFVQDDVFILA